MDRGWRSARRMTKSDRPTAELSRPADPFLASSGGAVPVSIIAPPSRARPLAVLIVSDHRVLRDSLSRGAAFAIGTASLAMAESIDEARHLASIVEVDLVILDVEMPGALACARDLRRLAPDSHLLGCAAPDSAALLAACAQAGISRCLTRQATATDLCQAIAALAAASRQDRRTGRFGIGDDACNAPYVRHSVTPPQVRTARSPLTPREGEIVALLDDGRSNKEIAARLAISVATVKQHVHNILAKLQAGRRGEAAARMRGRM